MLSFSVNGSKRDVTRTLNTYFLPYPCGSNKSNCFPYESVLFPGQYIIETWGASGGVVGIRNKPGKGGFSRGVLSISENTKAFFFVGAEGTTISGANVNTTSSFNGGGNGQSGYDGIEAASGGGGTDIRLQKSSLYYRVIVAGGGGGIADRSIETAGSGGGTNGGKAVPKTSTYPGLGGTQSKGGITTYSDLSIAASGSFGFGGYLKTWDGCGGGGGWYGGGPGYSWQCPGSGGSGFVFTKDNVQVAHDAGLLLSSKFFLFDSMTVSGEECFTSFSNPLVNETGHLGDGAIRITVIGFMKCNSIRPFHLFYRFYSPLVISFLIFRK